MPDQSVAGYTEVTWAEDRATRGRDPSAEPGAKTGVGGRTPPLGIPGIGRKAINPITCICISEWRSENQGLPRARRAGKVAGSKAIMPGCMRLRRTTCVALMVLQKRPCFCSPAARPDICPDLEGRVHPAVQSPQLGRIFADQMRTQLGDSRANAGRVSGKVKWPEGADLAVPDDSGVGFNSHDRAVEHGDRLATRPVVRSLVQGQIDLVGGNPTDFHGWASAPFLALKRAASPGPVRVRRRASAERAGQTPSENASCRRGPLPAPLRQLRAE